MILLLFYRILHGKIYILYLTSLFKTGEKIDKYRSKNTEFLIIRMFTHSADSWKIGSQPYGNFPKREYYSKKSLFFLSTFLKLSQLQNERNFYLLVRISDNLIF